MNRNIKKLMGTTVIAAILAGASATSAFAGWEQNGECWRYSYEADDIGTKAFMTGRFIDTDGNIYYFAPNGDMLVDQLASGGRYGSDGKLVSFYTLDEETKRLAESYKAGNTISLGSESEALDWIRRYNNYYYNGLNTQYTMYHKNNTYTVLQMTEDTTEATAVLAVTNLIDDLAYEVQTGSIEEKVKNVEIAVADKLEYAWGEDVETFNTSLGYSALTGKAQDLQYAKLANRVLSELGIESEIVVGDANNGKEIGAHAWLRVNLNQGTENAEKWMFCDPTWYDTSKETKYLNIDYNEYLANYWMDSTRR